MKLKNLDPKSIQIPETRVTARWDEEKLAMFRDGYKSAGQVAPIVCMLLEGKYILVDGFHRLMESINNGDKTIAVAYDEGDMVDVLTRNIFLDHLRGKHPASEMRRVIDTLYREYKISIEDIVRRTGMTRDYVEKLLTISELTPMCLEALDQEQIRVGHAAELVKIKEPDRQEVVLQMCIQNNWTVVALREFIFETQRLVAQQASVPAPPVEQAPIPPATAKCQGCGADEVPSRLAVITMCHSCQAIFYETMNDIRQQAARAAQVPADNDGHKGESQ